MAHAVGRCGLNANTDLAAYLDRIHRFPILCAADEHLLAKRWRERGDRAAADLLVTSHLRVVVKVAMSFRGYGFAIREVIAEGNLGLMRALKRFDPDRGLRFSTYAMFWIKAAMRAYVLRTWSLVRIGTTPGQRKLFFNLRAMKRCLAFGEGALHPDHVRTIAQRLGVRAQDVVDMNGRLAGDVPLEVPTGRAVDLAKWRHRMIDQTPGPDQELCARQESKLRMEGLAQALQTLTAREREILKARRLNESPPSLETLAARLGISRERVRQIEMQAFEKVQRAVKRRCASRTKLPGPLLMRERSTVLSGSSRIYFAAAQNRDHEGAH